MSLNSLSIIRLKPRGHRHYVIFEIIAILKKKRIKGPAKMRLGFINPQINEKVVFLDFHNLGVLMNKGAILHPSVAKYIAKFVFL